MLAAIGVSFALHPLIIAFDDFTCKKVSNLPAARIGDMTTHGGVIVTGFPAVLIGDAGGGGFGAGGATKPRGKRCMKSAARSSAAFVKA